MEETLLRISYKRGDAEFADWLIENNFYGDLQPELFYIIYAYDKEKARAVAGRLTPRCIAWILNNYTARYYDKRHSQRRQDDTIESPMDCIFSSITENTACSIKKHLPKRAGEVQQMYYELMNKYFYKK